MIKTLPAAGTDLVTDADRQAINAARHCLEHRRSDPTQTGREREGEGEELLIETQPENGHHAKT